jgi:hypothetical protein
MERSASKGPLDEDCAVWAAEPERTDPDDYPARAPFARIMTWAHCPRCSLQIHAPYTQFLLRGISCPNCSALLMTPPGEASAQLSLALRREDEFSRQLDTNGE